MCRIFEILRDIYFDFFQRTKLRQPTQGRDSCLKINNIRDFKLPYFVKFNNTQLADDMPETQIFPDPNH